MRFVIQRVQQASVAVDGKTIGEIQKGFMTLIGISKDDTTETADKMIRKMTAMRIFEDENGKTNLALADVGGSLLLISQFTLYANCKKGNRPSFIDAGDPDEAERLYEYIIEACKKTIPIVEKEMCIRDSLKVKSVDVEAWSPRQKKYFEVGSCSNLGDAQARRLGIRVKGKDGKYFAHTLNNTVVAPPRMLIAFLENNLQEDGSVKIPKVLQPYMGGMEVMIPKK